MSYEINAVARGVHAYLESIFASKEKFKNVSSSERDSGFELEIYKDRKIYVNSERYDEIDYAVIFVVFGDKNVQSANKKLGFSSFDISKMSNKEFDTFKEVAKLSNESVSKNAKNALIKIAFNAKELSDFGIDIPDVAEPSAPEPDPETVKKYESEDSSTLVVDKDGVEHDFTDTLELAKFIGLKESFLKKKLAKFTPQELYDYYAK